MLQQNPGHLHSLGHSAAYNLQNALESGERRAIFIGHSPQRANHRAKSAELHRCSKTKDLIGCGGLGSCAMASSVESKAPDEILSLAAAVQFCGFKLIVGTLWTMNDSDGPILAEQFYQNLLRNGQDGLV